MFQAGPIVMNVKVCPWHPWMQIVLVDLVRFLYGDHSKVGKSVTRFPDFGCRVSCSRPFPLPFGEASSTDVVSVGSLQVWQCIG